MDLLCRREDGGESRAEQNSLLSKKGRELAVF